jgi:synaptic vesicle membrane protein VAT-1
MKTDLRKAWRMDRAGSLGRLRLVDEHIPPPGENEVRIRVEAVGLNFADVFACLGLYSATPLGAFVPGLEFAGIVDEAGPGVFSIAHGDRVMGGTRFGGYASHLNVDSRYLYPLPEGWSSEQGAAFPVQVLTAWYALVELAAAKRGQTILIHSAAGGVGLQVLAILRKMNIRTIATVGLSEKADFLNRHAGLSKEQIIVRDRHGFGGQLDAALGSAGVNGFDCILDSVAGDFFRDGYRRLNRGGRLILFGAADFMGLGKRPDYLRLAWRYIRRPRPDPLEMISANKSIMGFNLIWLWEQHALFHSMMSRIAELQLPPPHIGARFPFDAAPKALRYLQSGRSIGKVILEI